MDVHMLLVIMLIKVWSASGLKKAVVADNLENLIEKGSSKLNLKEVKAFMEDGTEIDDNDVFQCLPEASVVYLLQENDEKPWIVNSSLQSSYSSDRSEVTSSDKEYTDGFNLRCHPWPHVFVIKDEKFSHDLKAELQDGNLRWPQKTELLHHLAEQILEFTENPTAIERKEVACALVRKFPALKSTIGDGCHAWCMRIYDKMREYRRQKRKRGIQNSNVEDKNSPSSYKAVKSIRPRGEINWAPPPPDGEDEISLNAHEEWLRKEFKKEPENQDKEMVNNKMILCFSSRRRSINSNVKSLIDLKEQFPFLFTADGLMKEFSLLMTIDIDKIFLKELSGLASKMLKTAEIRKKKPDKVNEYVFMFKNIPSNESHVNDMLVIAILLLPFLLYENSDFLYKIYPEETPLENVFEGPVTPHVVVIGSPFQSSLVFVVGEGQILIDCIEFLYGIIALVSFYFSCNVEYPDKGKQTYHFIEFEILKLKNKNIFSRRLTSLIDRLHKM